MVLYQYSLSKELQLDIYCCMVISSRVEEAVRAKHHPLEEPFLEAERRHLYSTKVLLLYAAHGSVCAIPYP
jgi:hypothetical protein